MHIGPSPLRADLSAKIDQIVIGRPKSTASKSTLIGAAGEHYVMWRLLRQGLIAALAPTGVPLADIIVTDDIGHRVSAIQVKTRSGKGADQGWHMKAKHEEIVSETIFYVFVDFGAATFEREASCHVVPSAVVADVLRRSHRQWLGTPGRGGRAHKDHDMRRLLPDYDRMGLPIGCGSGWLEPYRDAWPLLHGDITHPTNTNSSEASRK
ncbi:MAG TPA: hypothetical protein VGV37_04650 [Aliidongia sp.]|uniref:hypothetical protein n=1 Tax=Aliidongia sp. TaxID=1914230 RepID=UPI002DDDAB41|nr:hypothetical protein [Aliidongia sp.]HEV2673808.1 hypothetical protein [Aliidongia sp.]